MVIYLFSSISNSNLWLNRIVLSDLTKVFIKAITYLLWCTFFDIRHITEYCPCGNGWLFFSSRKKAKYYQSQQESAFSLTLWKSVCLFNSWQTGFHWFIVLCFNLEFNWVFVCNQHGTSLLLVSCHSIRRIGNFWVPPPCYTEINYCLEFNFNSNAQCLLLVSSCALSFWACLLFASRCSLIIPSVID